MTIKIVFCGSPDFSIPALDMIANQKNYETLTIISQPDKPAKRGKKILSTPITNYAKEKNIPFYTPKSKQDFKDLILKLNPDLILVIAYGMIIPQEITDNFICINAHASLLPKYRGASPIQASLLHQDKETGVCLIQMNEKMDEGDIIKSAKTKISTETNFGTLHDILANETKQLIQQFLNTFTPKTPIIGTAQDHDQATYCQKITNQDLYLNPNDSIKTNYGKIKAFSPKPGAYITHQNKRIKIIDASIQNNKIIPTQVHVEGKKVMSYDDYLKGYKTDIILC